MFVASSIIIKVRVAHMEMVERICDGREIRSYLGKPDTTGWQHFKSSWGVVREASSSLQLITDHRLVGNYVHSSWSNLSE